MRPGFSHVWCFGANGKYEDTHNAWHNRGRPYYKKVRSMKIRAINNDLTDEEKDTSHITTDFNFAQNLFNADASGFDASGNAGDYKSLNNSERNSNSGKN